MPLLFSYGTLQEADVQLPTFGRILSGQRDELPGFEPSSVRVEDPQVTAETGRTHYANVAYNGRSDSRVSGTVFEITETDLAAADAYEQPAAYERVAAILASGKRAWVYLRPGPEAMPRISELFLFARFHARPGCRVALRQAIGDVQEPTRKEPGCLSYCAFQSVRDPDEFYVHSRWRDRAAFELHANLPHTVRFLAAVGPLIDHPVNVSLTEPLQ